MGLGLEVGEGLRAVCHGVGEVLRGAYETSDAASLACPFSSPSDSIVSTIVTILPVALSVALAAGIQSSTRSGQTYLKSLLLPSSFSFLTNVGANIL
jgi:hypothetical protein